MSRSDSSKPTRTLPPSATNGWTAFAGAAAFIGSVAILYKSNPFPNIAYSALFVLLFTAAAIFSMDLPWQNVHRRGTTGLDFSRHNLSWSRSLCKFIGLLGSFAFIGLLYWVFPEYHGAFYDNYYRMLKFVLPVWVLASIPYIVLIDRIMRVPQDSYWHMGKAVMLQWQQVDFAILRQHLTGWLIKGYFLPLMFTYFCNDLKWILASSSHSLSGFPAYYHFFSDAFYFVDVGLVSMGYLISLRLTDTHLRSAEPTMLGWVVALVCYEPFWSQMGQQYLNYGNGYGWEQWLSGFPLLYMAWGSVILLLVLVYVWATVAFGARFSNLTHRGIITGGPYRYTKHPAYIAKNLSWWLISIPFIVHGNAWESMRCCLALLMLNGIYWLRAKTEEIHLSRDPDYVSYALWMKERGIFRFLNRRKIK